VCQRHGYDHSIFPNRHAIYRPCLLYTNKARGGGLTAIRTPAHPSIIPTVDDMNLLVGNHYFSPGTTPEIIGDCFRLPVYKTEITAVGDPQQ
jgi:hypothetical protein